MKRILTLLTSLLLIVACDTPIPSSSAPIEAPVTESPINEEETALNSQEAIYERCTVYAGSTDFYFKVNTGEKITIRVSNLPDEREIIIPDNLVGSGGEEGPPEANPAMVGKVFLIIYDQEDNVTEIKLKE